MVLKFKAVHPGKTLRAELRAQGLNPNSLSIKLQIPSMIIYDIVKEKRGISAQIALRLGRYFKQEPLFWMNLQANYELALAERFFGEDINLIQPINSDRARTISTEKKKPKTNATGPKEMKARFDDRLDFN